MDFDYEKIKIDNYEAYSKSNYIENPVSPFFAVIERESTGCNSSINRNQTVTNSNEDNDVNMTVPEYIHEYDQHQKDENPFDGLIKKRSKNDEQHFPMHFNECSSPKNINLGYYMGFESDFDQNHKNKFYPFTLMSIKYPYNTFKEDLKQSKTILINIEEKSLEEIDNYYRSLNKIRWFSRYSMQRKIKTYFLKHNYDKLVSLICKEYHYKFLKFQTENFVEKIDIESEKILFSYLTMKEIMKVKDFVIGESIEIFIQTETNFKNNESYLEFTRIISLDYAGWIKEYLSCCSENYGEAEKKIKIYQTKFLKNINGEKKAALMRDYFKLFWYEAEDYINYFQNTLPKRRFSRGRI